MYCRSKVAWLTLATLLVGEAVVLQKAIAIPYFARKYKTTCLRCHTAVPKLNAFGKNFQLHGYQQPGDRSVNKVPIPEDKNLSLLDQIPVAILVENDLNLDRSVNGNQTPTSIESPWAFRIFAADSIAPDLGFFGEVSTEDGGTDVGKVSLIATYLGGTDANLQVGKLDPVEHGVTEHDLFTRSGYSLQDLDLGGVNLAEEHQGVRLFGTFGSSVSKELIHSKPSGDNEKPDVGDSNGSDSTGASVEPTKDQGKDQGKEKAEMEEADPMNTLVGFLWEVGFYNSNGAGGATARDAGDFSARLNAYFGGDSFIGLVGFAGRTTVESGATNSYRMGGVDLSISFGELIEKTPGMKIKQYNLLASYLSGSADNPLDTGEKVNWHGYFIELDRVIGQRAMAVLKYNRVNGGSLLDAPANSGLFSKAITANVTYYLRTNFWAGLEYTKDLNAGGKNNALGLVFSFAF
jgi:hypothetical protein